MKDIWLKRIWLINGIILLIFFLLGLVFISNELYYQYKKNNGDERGVIVGKIKKKADNDNLELQTVSLSLPHKIYNSDISFISVFQKDYNTPKNVLELSRSANQYQEGMRINIIFINPSKNYSKLLLDKKCSISIMNYPSYTQDTLQKHIYYEISFNDTDQNGRINSQDRKQYFISNLDGTGFKRILPPNYQVEEYSFSDDYLKLFFICNIKPKDQKIPVEYWDKTSIEYNIKDGTLLVNDKLNLLINEAKKIMLK